MRISFDLIDDQNVIVLMEDEGTKEKRRVGLIFSPSGSGRSNKSAVQVCGFEKAFDLWGCGIFSSSKERLKARKDIQLLFDFDTHADDIHHNQNNCDRCYSRPCHCENPKDHRHPFNLKRESDLVLEEL